MSVTQEPTGTPPIKELKPQEQMPAESTSGKDKAGAVRRRFNEFRLKIAGKANEIKGSLTGIEKRNTGIDFRQETVEMEGLEKRLAGLGEQTERMFKGEEENGIPKINLQEKIDKALAEKGMVPPDFESQGASGFFGTNERLNPGDFRELSGSPEHPNGYIIGAGVSSIFTAMEAFPSSSLPEGIILINIDPKAVQEAGDFVEALTKGKVLIGDMIGRRSFYVPGESKLLDYDPYFNGSENIDTGQLVRLQADKLIQLARKGKIVVLQQDLFNENILKIIKENLPDLDKRRNVINLSNIGDWIARETVFGPDGVMKRAMDYMKDHPDADGLPTEQVKAISEEKFRCLNNLQLLAPEEPDFNYFMWTSIARGYNQTMTKSLPGKNNFAAL